MSRERKGQKGPGRPAVLSRKMIVQAALELLAEQPKKRLTMQALAKRLNAAPMSLYTHIRNREDLLQALSEEILGEIEFKTQPGNWQATVCDWARAIRRQFLRYPFAASLLQDGMATPVAWLQVSNPLLQALSQAGLQGQALADAQRWLSRVVIGSILMELLVPAAVPDEAQAVAKAFQLLSSAEQGVWQQVLPELGQLNDEQVFEYSLQRSLVALEQLISNCRA